MLARSVAAAVAARAIWAKRHASGANSRRHRHERYSRVVVVSGQDRGEDSHLGARGNLVPGWTAWRWATVIIGLFFALAGCLLASIISVIFDLSAVGAVTAMATVVLLFAAAVCVFVQARKVKRETKAGYTTVRATETSAQLADVDPTTGVIIRAGGTPIFQSSAERNAARAKARMRNG